MNATRLLFASAGCLVLGLGLAACGSDTTTPATTDNSGGDGGQTLATTSSTGTPASTTSTSATTTATATTSSTGATGGGGAGGEGGTGGAGGGTGGAGGGTGGAGTGGGGGAPTTVDHLVISEIAISDTNHEFIEIYNPTAAAIDLTDYYFSDNGTYYLIAEGHAFTPTTSGNIASDFLVRFPAGATIAAGAVQTIAIHATFSTTYPLAGCPTYSLPAPAAPCSAGLKPTKQVVVPTNGGLDDTKVTLSDDREMVVVFKWDGTSMHPVQDVDYVTWGPNTDPQARIVKTADGLYKADTAAASQRAATPPAFGHSIERCKLENGEKQTGGNGITGHDETSEPLDVNFVDQAIPTPGTKNACLP